MNIRAEQDGSIAVYYCDGEFNLAGGATLSEKLATLPGETRSLVLDLSGITYMDSSGIGQLVSAFKKCSIEDRHFAIAGLTANVSQLLSITKLDHVFKICENVEQAKTDFK